ncbi:hypothetical protein GCG54_00000404 [Colletotrichum gloeosporioides]|uniref:Uncharacterized protein n=1 Tax=Colletotrichum gloeosporioides TaxID=474922 RepID=A0A8H4CUU4_COLGL|nr:uncharacterized protein GCG54_00000404 [Colletotrichum gloeosporioides]KAF3810359.1 hypothetical protein GCG54_00000404 [Colletotrichum gloeosporioides]
MSAASSPAQSTGSTPDRPRAPAVARWGAACAPCATAKAKCLRSNSKPGSKCDSASISNGRFAVKGTDICREPLVRGQLPHQPGSPV